MKNNNILGLDVSTNNCSVALLSNGVIEEISSVSSTIKAQMLLSMINELLLKAKINGTEVTALAFGAGPGSFTGLKVASSVIQGLHLAWNKPIVKVSTLWALALQAFELHKGDTYLNYKYIMPCIDAKMGQVYYGMYEIALNNNHLLPHPLQDDSLAEPKDIKIFDNETIVIGDGASILQKMPDSFTKKLIIDHTIQYVNASSIIKLAEYWYKDNYNVTNNADPIYLKLYD